MLCFSENSVSNARIVMAAEKGVGVRAAMNVQNAQSPEKIITARRIEMGLRYCSQQLFPSKIYHKLEQF